MRLQYLSFLVCAIFTVAVPAQDPTKVAPDSYKLQFENDIVKVTRVHYVPKAKVPKHDHSRWPAAYVYLNDAGQIIFTHDGWEHPALTRRAVKGKSFRLSPTTAEAETHSVENPGDTPSDFLRIEFKTLVQGSGLPHGRYPAVEYPSAKNFSSVHFENAKVRVTRVGSPAGKNLTASAHASTPALLVILTSTRAATPGGKLTGYQAGETIWLAGGTTKVLENSASTPLEILRFDFKLGR